MKPYLQTLVIGLAALAQAGCSKIDPISAPAAVGGSASFATVASIGTSVTAGVESGGLVVHHQQKAFPYAFAKQVGAAFEIPSISADGIPALLEIQGWAPGNPPKPIISNSGRTTGTPTNFPLPRAYNNMGVPASLLIDVTDASRYGSGAFPLIANRAPSSGTILDQVASLRPTFVTFEMGSNEVLGPATQGSGTPIMSVPAFTGLLGVTLDSLEALMPNAKVAIFTVPDIVSLPFFTTISPRLDPTGACRVLGPGPAPLTDNDLVLLTAGPLLAAGHGVPSLCGGLNDALPATVVLPAASVASIQAAVDGYNTAIRAAATARGYALVDLNALLTLAATTGYVFQGQTYTSDFVTGGLISLDGIHPTDLSHGVICNALIDAVNKTFGAHVTPLNLAEWATATSSRARPAGGIMGIPVVEHPDAVYGPLFGWRGIVAPTP